MILTDRSCNLDLHGHSRWWRDSVVKICHEASIHTTFDLLARRVKSGLGCGVVLRLELEDDHVSNSSGDLVGCVD